MNYMVKTGRKTMRSSALPSPLFSPRSVTSQDALNLLGSSNLTNYWPQGELCPSAVCSPLSRAQAGLEPRCCCCCRLRCPALQPAGGLVTLNLPLFLSPFFHNTKGSSPSLEQHDYSQSNYCKLREKTPPHSFL